MRRKATLITTISFLLVGSVWAIVFCPDDRYPMPIDHGLPWGAIGYLDNGCTATLIGPQHILAAAHCFACDIEGTWQNDLRFYPNYSPQQRDVTGYVLDRMVVGTRVATGGEFQASDWGIGHLAEPVSDYPFMTIAPAPRSFWKNMRSAGYGRDPHFFTPPNGPTCTICGNPSSNCWWEAALVDPQCRIIDKVNHELLFDCAAIGGNSGSPVFWQPRRLGRVFGRPGYFITGVIHGAPAFNEFGPCEIRYRGSKRANVGPSAEKFQFAPRFAADVAVAKRTSGHARTHFYALDTDTRRVVVRSRRGKSHLGPFSVYRELDDETFSNPHRMAAFNHPSFQEPILLVIDGTELRLRIDFAFFASWSSLSNLGPVLDVDPLFTDSGVTETLFFIGQYGAPYELRLETDLFPFPSINLEVTELPTGAHPYERIAAIRRSGGAVQLFLLNALGEVDTLYHESGGAWVGPLPYGNPIRRLRDLDASFTHVGQVQVFATGVDGNLWTRSAPDAGDPSQGWSNWRRFSLPLYAPASPTVQPPPENLLSVTATKWQEWFPGIDYVLFVTDAFGNIYYTIQSTPQWDDWRSFYH